MDDTLARLKDISDDAIKAFESWSKKRTDHAATEKATAAVHELRKVAARLEVELITSERADRSAAPLPIPAHRSSGPQQQVAPSDERVSDTPAVPRPKIKRLKTEPGDEE